ncbi:MAG: deoxyguanosinetriphosphate triphosphohydrolase [Deltaproteobacteria bacterium]|nr:deoxyguanosinetriphosphate triphosphohydrolase [Deltaproteobacteria bacterium]
MREPLETGRRRMSSGRLARYAARDQDSLGREFQERFKDRRPHFERDRDRIIHCSAFRRLEYKTQVFVNHEGDYYRTRLTHSIEVAQISRGLAKVLGLNGELAEALALAHDLGHTPFGHSGEDTLAELMKDHGGFEHNGQSLRVVTVLEDRYPGFRGLNLSFETREGIVKHSSYYDHPHPERFAPYRPEWQPTLEAQMINHTDAIAYLNHDIDDGLESGLLEWDGLCRLPIWQRMLRQVRKRYGKLDARHQKTMAISHLIGYLMNDLAAQTKGNLKAHGVATMMDVRKAKTLLVEHSAEAAELMGGLRRYLFDSLYKHYRLERRRFQAQNTIRMLFRAYAANPTMMPGRYLRLADEFGMERAIADYIAGMTDRYALQEYAHLYEAPTGP